MASLSLLALIYLIFPRKFSIDTLLYCLWGFMGLIEGDGVVSLLMSAGLRLCVQGGVFPDP
jgi:hypothetical protein